MRREIGLLVLCGWMSGIGGSAIADDRMIAVALRDGSRLVGRVVSENDTSLTVVTSDGLEVVVRRASVVSMTHVGEDGRSIAVDPNYSRLMFAPTGRP